MVLITGEPPQQLVGNDRNDLRSAAADDLRHRILRQLAIPMAHRPDRLDLRRIHVGDRQTVEAAVRIHDIDGAPVGQTRHGQTGGRTERGAVVQRGRQHLAHFGQEGHLLTRSLGAAPRGQNGGDQAADREA